MRKLLQIAVIVTLVVIVLNSCKKEAVAPASTGVAPTFVRVAIENTDGTYDYSNTIRPGGK